MNDSPNSQSRCAGLVLPLFSCVSTRSWGIGDIGDLAPFTGWLARAGVRVLQLLPINEMAPGQQSPYSALSAMAIDPLFIHVPDVAEFAAAGGEAALGSADRERLDAVRGAPRIRHAEVRQLKRAALAAAFERFVEREWRPETVRGRALRTFLAEQAWWIEDYALFRAIHASHAERSWLEWPEALRRREPAEIDRVRRELGHDVLFQQYLQWIADTQWKRARAAAAGVALYGDLPFMVDGDSADVWARQGQFRLDVSLGVPPDAFSEHGQDWGMPVYRWEAVAADDFRWLRERARRGADLYEGYRVDHLVGFYRTYGRPRDGSPAFFDPATEPEQTALGERVLAVFREPGADIIAEDLGTVPDFVRESLARLAVPGFRVLRWEREWHEPGEPFRDPADYPACSVGTSGTHDTDPLVVWWERADAEERRKVTAVPTIRRIAARRGVADLTVEPYEPHVRETLIEALFASGSRLLLIPLQDVFGWRDRINEPAKVDDTNWTFRLPTPVDRLDEEPQACACQQALRAWAGQYGRLPAPSSRSGG